MEDFIGFIVRALVGHPDKVSVTASESEEGTKISVQVMPEDAGLVIGKRGYVIRAIRQLANVKASNQNKRIFVDVVPIE